MYSKISCDISTLDQQPGATTETDGDERTGSSLSSHATRWPLQSETQNLIPLACDPLTTHQSETQNLIPLACDPLMTHQSETQNLIPLACDPLITEPMKVVSVSATPGTVISLVLGLVFRQTYKNEALTVPSGLANWLDRSPSAKSYVQKTLTRQLLFFVHSRLCPKQVMFPAP